MVCRYYMLHNTFLTDFLSSFAIIAEVSRSRRLELAGGTDSPRVCPPLLAAAKCVVHAHCSITSFTSP